MGFNHEDKNKIDICIRKSEIDDAKTIYEIEKSVFSPKLQYGYPIIVGLITTSLTFLALTAYVKDSKRITGFITGEIDEKNNRLGRLITIEVDSEFQSHNIGSKLLLQFEKNLKKYYSVQEVELQVHSSNEIAISFYKKHNYQRIKELRNYYARGEHAILMRKNLA